MRLTDRALEANLENKKTVFRRKAKEMLKKELKKGVYSKDKAFEKNLLLFVKRKNLKKILMFLPLPIEPNIMSAIKKLRKLKKSIYVPFIEDISFKIVKYRLPVKQGAYNIFSCNNSHEFIKKIDMAIVPAIGIDLKFRRIGFGKGMYDRFFGSLRYKPVIAFAQRTFNFSKEDIGEAHDAVGDYLILPNKIFTKGRIKNAYNTINGYGGRCVVRTDRIFRSKKNRFDKVSNLHRAVKVKS
jgi:5-formyltetrahydrofolate cyclo-ligase